MSVMELGHLLTRSGLTYLEVSSEVCHDSFCQLGNSVSLLAEGIVADLLYYIILHYIILHYITYHCVTIAYSIEYSNMLYRFVA